jgi:HlyD family secretion protein
MNLVRRIIVIVLLVAGAGYLAWRTWAPRPENAAVLSGYIEGELLYLSAPVSGTITALNVARGDRVAAGQPLFTIDVSQLRAQRDQAAAALAAAHAQVVTAGARLAQSRASAAATAAQAENAAHDLIRYRTAARADRASISLQQLDTAVANAANTEGQSMAASSDVAAQEAQVAVAEAQEKQQAAVLAEQQSKLDQLTPHAPGPARVQDTFYQLGEWAAANQPVVSLLPDNRVRIRFFVPVGDVPRYHAGEVVHFSCDGCTAGLTARINYVSPQPEFTPPIIYSRSSRDRLVFLVEAEPRMPRELTPGLPVDVMPLGR